MTWNHRLLFHDHPEEPWLGMHEVFYDDDGNPDGCTAEPVAVTGETVDEVKEVLEWMLAACQKPVLEYEMFEKMEPKAVDLGTPITVEELDQLLKEGEENGTGETEETKEAEDTKDSSRE